MAIAKLLKNKNAKEKASIKGREIAKLKIPKTKRANLEFEIVELKAIEGGVEVFARAWKNSKQLGFGQDGSVDIERFKIFNPPILVPDENGDIVREWTDEITGEQKQYKLREDPEEALIQVIEHNLSVMKNIHGDEKVVQGKKGNTTSTFYPDSTAIDGRALIMSAASWTAAVNGNGNFHDDNTTTLQLYSNYADKRIDRVMVLFPTGSLPDDDTISAATLSVYGASKANDALTMAINITQSNPASDTAFADSDYQAMTPFTTKLSSDLSYASFTTSAYNDFTLNASGIAVINKTGNSKFAVRYVNDITDSDPGSGTDENLQFSGYSTLGTSQDPKLVVEHSAAATTTTPTPTLLTLNCG